MRELRHERDWTQEQAADAFGLSKSGYIKIETGERGLSLKWVARAAEIYGIPKAAILSDDVTNDSTAVDRIGSPTWSIPVVGKAEAGSWLKDVDDVQERDYPEIPASPEKQYEKIEQFAVAVVGDSMERAKLTDGSYAICVPYWHVRRGIADGDVAYVRLQDGAQFEATIKRVRIVNGVAELHSESSNPKHSKPLIYDQRGGSTVEIVGLVIGKYEPIK